MKTIKKLGVVVVSAAVFLMGIMAIGSPTVASAHGCYGGCYRPCYRPYYGCGGCGGYGYGGYGYGGYGGANIGGGYNIPFSPY